MAKFVEVHSKGNIVLVNLDKVDSIVPSNNGTSWQMYGDWQKVDETYDVVKHLIGVAQGGIPIMPER